MRAVITGGAGLIGSHIAEQLLRDGQDEVVIFDDFSRGRLANLAWSRVQDKLTVVQGDIRDRAQLAQVLAGADVVFHQAAIRITQVASDPRLGMEVLVDGTFNVLEACLAAGVRKVVSASSASVYGAAETFPTGETHHPYGNRTLYGAAKAFSEGMLRSFHEMHGLDYVALRYFNVYGPRMDVEGVYTEVLVRWMERIFEGLPPVVHGDGQQTMDFVHVDDVARANILAARSSRTDVVYNVASGTESSLLDIAEVLLRVMGSDLAVERGPARQMPAVPRRLADTTAAQRELGFTAEVGLESGLHSLVDWWHEQQGAESFAGRP